MSPALPARTLAAYGALGLPLAMAALPVYVHAPKLYADDFGLSLAAVGALLLGLRLVDAVQDPLIGVWSDRVAARGGRAPMLWAWAPLLALGFFLLFNPPALGPAGLAAWLAGSLLLTYTAFSVININYLAAGAELSADVHQRTRVTATREGLALAGVLVAAALPAALGAGAAGLQMLVPLFCVALVLAVRVTAAVVPPSVPARPNEGWFAAMAAPLANPSLRRLLVPYALSGIASAIPATLVLFFVEDVLRAPDLAGPFLATYFLCGAAGMPLWVRAARTLGKQAAWVAGMVLSVAAFVWAFLLGEGDTAAFFAVCALSGLALGADLALPPSLLADVTDRDPKGAGGSYFGLWNLVGKLNLALAAGIALPLLAALDYAPGSEDPEALRSLALIYALLPSLLKLLAAAWLLAQLRGRPCRPLGEPS